jgi:hypothetical protein
MTDPSAVSGGTPAGNLIVPSTSNSNSLSGNDYVEVTTTGETKPLTKKVYSSSNSLNKSLTKLATDDGMDHQRQYNPYDNTPEIRSNGAAAKSGKKGDGKWRDSSASAGCHSEFVDFFDNIDERAGSVKSINRYTYATHELTHDLGEKLYLTTK